MIKNYLESLFTDSNKYNNKIFALKKLADEYNVYYDDITPEENIRQALIERFRQLEIEDGNPNPNEEEIKKMIENRTKIEDYFTDKDLLILKDIAKSNGININNLAVDIDKNDPSTVVPKIIERISESKNQNALNQLEKYFSNVDKVFDVYKKEINKIKNQTANIMHTKEEILSIFDNIPQIQTLSTEPDETIITNSINYLLYSLYYYTNQLSKINHTQILSNNPFETNYSMVEYESRINDILHKINVIYDWLDRNGISLENSKKFTGNDDYTEILIKQKSLETIDDEIQKLNKELNEKKKELEKIKNENNSTTNSTQNFGNKKPKQPKKKKSLKKKNKKLSKKHKRKFGYEAQSAYKVIQNTFKNVVDGKEVYMGPNKLPYLSS